MYQVQQYPHTALSSYVRRAAAVAGVDDRPALSYRKGSDWLGANDLFSAMLVTGTRHWRYALKCIKGHIPLRAKHLLPYKTASTLSCLNCIKNTESKMAVNSNPVLQTDAAVILLFHVVIRRKV